MKRILVISLLVAPLFAQSNTGELRLKVTDPAGLAMKSSVEIISEANHYRKSLLTDDAGNLVVKQLPFGVYLLEVGHAGFAPFSGSVEIRSAAPANQLVKLSLARIGRFYAMVLGDPGSETTSSCVSSSTPPILPTA